MRVNRFDVAEIGRPVRTPQGFLRVPAYLTRAGVLEYKRDDGSTVRELRHPDEADPDNSSRSIVRLLGQAGWLRFAVPAEFGGRSDRLDVRSLCILREKLAFESGLADFAFAMQGLGAGPIDRKSVV